MIRVLTVRQPYATMICKGLKSIEFRTWSTKHRGRLYIHASRQEDLDIFGFSPLLKEYDQCVDMRGHKIKETKYINIVDNEIVLLDETERVAFDLLKTEIKLQCQDPPTTLFLQHSIIGHVDLVDIEKAGKQYNWILENPVYLSNPVIGVKGKLKIWTMPDIINQEA